MAYGNQWMNPAMYKNMNNEQVDWASLAQQWIKMKETTTVMPPAQPVAQPVRPTTCEPTLLRPSRPIDPQGSNVKPPNKALGDHNTAGHVTGNNNEKPSAWNSWTWQQQQQWNWNWASSSTAPPPKTPIMEPVNPINPIRPPYVAPPVLTEPPPSFPIMSSNKPFTTNNYWAGPNTRIPPPIETDHWNKPNMLPSVDDRNQDLSYMDAAKRKQLPAWIREGLEKMEREKRRKIELEQSVDDSDYSNSNNDHITQELHHSPDNFEHDVQMVDDETEHDLSDYINDTEPKKTEYLKNEPPPLIPRKTKAQIWEDTMLILRPILTKLLMDVTNDMMLSVVKDVLKTSLQSDIQGNESQTSLAGKLGLGAYGSESDTSDESDDEHLPGHKQSVKQDSDEAIQDRILKRQREFSNIEARILMELDQLEEREKLVRSKFDSSIKLGGDINDTGSQVVENIQTKGKTEDDGPNQKLEKGHDKNKKELFNDLSTKNGQKKKKSKSKRSSSSSDSSSSSESSKKSDDSDNKYSYKKNDKIKSKSSNKKSKSDSVKRKRRSRSKNRSRSHSRSKRSRSRSRHRSRSHQRHDRRSPHSYRSRRSRSPVSRHGSSRKYKSKRNSSSSSNESRNTKHRYRR